MTFNPFAPEVRADPYPSYARLRDDAPVHRIDTFGFWIVTRHEDVQFVMKNHNLFSSEGMRGAPSDEEMTKILIATDPPDHTRLRTLVSRAFTPRMVAALEPRIREITRELVSRVESRSGFDVIGDLALPLPVRVIAEMLGVDPGRVDDFKRWSDIMVGRLLRPSATAEQVAYETAEANAFGEYFQWVIEDRRAHPGDDLISALVHAEEDDGALTADEVVGFAALLLIAGNETTTNLIGNMALALLRHPDQLDELIADPALIPNAVEEALRYDSPVQIIFRLAREDVELGGHLIPRGAMVWPVLGSANRDERRFPDPDRFDIHRDLSGHMAFGHGIHFCLGAPLARMEARVAMEALLPHIAGASLRSDPLEYIDAFFLRGLKRLPLNLRREAAVA